MTTLTFKIRRRGTGPDPVQPELSIVDDLAALPEEETVTPAPVPTYTPNDPAVTGPMPALPMPALPGQPPAEWAAPDRPTLSRLAQALRSMDTPGHIARFNADRAELPVFGAAIRETGWHGVHLPPGQGYPRFQPLSAARWEQVQRDRIKHQTEPLRAALRQRSKQYDAIEKQRRADADARSTPKAAA